MGGQTRIPLKTALYYARRFEKLIKPYCDKTILVGSCRRLSPDVGDIEIVCVLKEMATFDMLFHKDYPGLVVNGNRLKRFKYPKSNLQIELYITNMDDYGRIVAIRTGSSAYSHYKLATTWNRLGWCGTKDGLRRKKECEKKGNVWKIKDEYAEDPTLPDKFNTEEKFFQFLGMDWIPPEKRNWKSKYEEYNYSD